MSLTPYYVDDLVSLYLGDCREEWPEQVHSVVTSPPYNSDVEYDEHDDHMSPEEYRELARIVAERTVENLVTTGRSWFNTGNTQLPVWMRELEDAGLTYYRTICWDYILGTSDTAWGSWQSPSAPNIRHAWEPVICSYKGDWKIDRVGGESFKDTRDDWQLITLSKWPIAPGESRRTGSVHPAVMPLKLAENCIRLSTWPGEIVLDPFAGIGTTLLAAKQTGRKSIGIEKSERYCEIAAKRLAQGQFFDLASLSATAETEPCVG